MDKKLLGKRINIARKSKGMTSEQLSEACSINAVYLRQIESGVKTPRQIKLIFSMIQSALQNKDE